MRLPRARVTVEWTEITKKDLTVVVVITAIGFLFARAWSSGSSLFRFESTYWDLGLIPILTALVTGVLRGGGSDTFRRRFLLGFEVCGWAAVAAYIVSCSRPARWSLVSVLLPFQTGYMLAPYVGESWRNLKFWNILVDTAILISLPLILATVGGLMFSVRFTMRRIVVAVAVIAIVLGALVTMGRRIRRFDGLATYHESQIMGVMYGTPGPDRTMTFSLSSHDRNGRPLPPQQQIIDRWHFQMKERYRRAAVRPWLPIEPDPPEPE
jgi:hypothetical protein